MIDHDETDVREVLEASPIAPDRRPTQLAICRACMQFIYPTEIDCPHCGKNVLLAALDHQEKLDAANEAGDQLRKLLESIGVKL